MKEELDEVFSDGTPHGAGVFTSLNTIGVSWEDAYRSSIWFRDIYRFLDTRQMRRLAALAFTKRLSTTALITVPYGITTMDRGRRHTTGDTFLSGSITPWGFQNVSLLEMLLCALLGPNSRRFWWSRVRTFLTDDTLSEYRARTGYEITYKVHKVN